MDTKALRQKILDLAIRGKLVPQDPNDEPASVLLDRIRAQKQQMVKEGKLKAKDIKNDTIIFKGEDNLYYEKFQDGSIKCIEDEIPFEIPQGWEWCRLSHIASFSGGKTPSTSKKEYWGKEVLWVTSKDIKEKYIASSLMMLSHLGASIMQIYPIDTILIVTRSGILRHTLPIAILKEESTVNQDIKAVSLVLPKLAEYIYCCLKGMEPRLLKLYVKSGVTVENINFDKFQNVLLPIAPFDEMQRILNISEIVLCYINDVEYNKSELAKIIKVTKSRILDLAIRGKLVPQDPNDEPASVLLERIRAEKEELIKQGKIKRDKKESVIFKGDDNSYYEKVGNKITCIDDEIPFEIPDGWQFVRLKELWELLSGRDLSTSEYNTKLSGIPYITGASNFTNGNISITRWTEYPQVITEMGDLLLTCKGTVGEIAYNSIGCAHIARQIMALRSPYHLNIEYLKLCLEYNINKIKAAAKGLIPGISREDILNLLLPIPSEYHQTRIVEQAQNLNMIINSIGANLN